MGNSNNVPPEARKTVVVLGLGPTGVAFLRGLIDAKATGLFNILIVEPKDSYYHAVASLRAVVDTDVASKFVTPYEALVRRAGPTARHIRGKATSVTEAEVVVTLNDGSVQTLGFDYLVIGIGTNAPFPGQWTPGSTSSDTILQSFHDCRAALTAARNVVIIGGGTVGIELAGEIADAFKGANRKTITIVNSGAHLLPHDKLKRQVIDSLDTKLQTAGIAVRNGVRADVSGRSFSATTPFITGPVAVNLSDGSQLSADIVFGCVGTRPNNSSLAGGLRTLLDEHGRLRVQDSLQVIGHPNIFAGGDICNTAEGKLAYVADQHGQLIAKNLVALIHKKALKPHKLVPPVLFVPLGKSDGVGQMPNGMVVGKRIVTALKGKHLFVSETRKRLYM